MGAALADLDITPLRIGADAVLVALVALNLLMGFRYGVVRRIVAFAGLYLGCLVATLVGNGLASLVAPHSLYANAWFFIGVTAVVVLMVELLGALYGDLLRRGIVILFDRSIGAFAGVIVGAAEASIAFLVALAVSAAPAVAGTNLPSDRGRWADAIRTSSISGQLVQAEPFVRTVFQPVLPKDLRTHLVEGIGSNAP